MVRHITRIAAALLMLPAVALAQDNPAGRGQAGPTEVALPAALVGRPTVSAVRADEPPRLDGRLDDPVWSTAARVTSFVQRRPMEGAPATEATDVYIAYDSQKIYFGIHAHYSDTSMVRANRVDRDQTQTDDKITVYFDPFLDQQRAYGFAVNPYGVQRDAVLGGIGGPGGDISWNALYDTAATRVEDGWTAEMAIPFKSLRYPQRRPGEAHRWALQIERDIEGKNEAVVWAPISSSVTGFITQMGVLDGLANLTTSRNLEFLPSVTAIQTGHVNEATGAFVTGRSGRGRNRIQVWHHVEPDVRLHVQPRLLAD